MVKLDSLKENTVKLLNHLQSEGLTDEDMASYFIGMAVGAAKEAGLSKDYVINYFKQVWEFKVE